MILSLLNILFILIQASVNIKNVLIKMAQTISCGIYKYKKTSHAQ